MDCSKIRHLIVFVHGLTNRCTQHNLCHGQALFQAQAVHNQNILKYNNQSYMFFSRANLGVTGHDTFTYTSQGIEIAGDRLARELDSILRYDFKNITHLSLIGASLGGLFSRFAIAQLLATKKSVIIEQDIKLHAFVTLATPHLGSYNLKKTSLLISENTNSRQDLFLCNDVLENLAVSSSDILGKFAHRVTYAPLIDDNIVSWCTSALSLASSPCNHFQTISSAPVQLIRQYELSELTDNKCDWIDNETNTRSSKVIRMAQLLKKFPWTIVDVNMSHKHLATLYPSSQSQKVAAHILKWLKINNNAKL